MADVTSLPPPAAVPVGVGGQQTSSTVAPGPSQGKSPTHDGNYIVRARGLPYDASRDDVIRFLSGCNLLRGAEGVHILVGVDGRSKGEALVELAAEEDVEKAMRHHTETMGHRYIEILQINRLEMEWEMNQQPPAPYSGDYLVRLRGLPWSAQAKDVLELLKDCVVLNGDKGIHFTFAPDGRASGEAFVELCSEEDVSKALSHNRDHIGKRYVEIFRASRGQLDWEGRLDQKGVGGFGGVDGGVSGGVVRLRGLPFRCTEEDVRKFFQGLGIPPNGVILQKDQDNRETGEAYVEFVSPEDVEKALEKDRQEIGHRYIEVFRSTGAEIKPTIYRGGFGGRPTPYDRPGPPGGGGGGGGEGFNSYGMKKHGSGYERPYRGGRGRGGRGGGGGGGGNIMPPYDPYAGYYEGLDFYPPMPYTEGYGAPQNLVTYPPIRPSQGPGGRGGGGGGGFGGASGGPQSRFVVRMRGLPFSAKEKDIESFFAPSVCTKINIDFDHYGRPSGEAEVFFASHKEAVAAMQKNNAHMGHRYIELFLNSSDDPVAAMPVAPGGGQIVRPPAVAVGGAVISAPGVGLAQQQQYTYGYDTSMHGRPTVPGGTPAGVRPPTAGVGGTALAAPGTTQQHQQQQQYGYGYESSVQQSYQQYGQQQTQQGWGTGY